VKKTLSSILVVALSVLSTVCIQASVSQDIKSILDSSENSLHFYDNGTNVFVNPEVLSTDVQKILKEKLNAEEASQIADLFYKRLQQDVKANFGPQWAKKVLVMGDDRMPFAIRLFGEKPADGRALYISMHGGGSAPKALNDQQWINQVGLYQPEEGIYIAPRAPYDAWNMWFYPRMTEFFDRLIQLAVIELDVNPDKVYLMGYSAGGDGVYRMAPRMADRWAAASMMAGHPGDITPQNLRNIGFTLWVGGKDAAYQRNETAKAFGDLLAKAKENDPEGYTYEVHIVENKSHWMDLEDSAAVPWMAKFKRNTTPNKVSWRQEENDYLGNSFYWLAIPKEEAAKGKSLIVARNGNIFEIQQSDYKKVSIFMNDDMVDFSKTVKVRYKDETLFEGTVDRNAGTIWESFQNRRDRSSAFSGKIVIDIPEI